MGRAERRFREKRNRIENRKGVPFNRKQLSEMREQVSHDTSSRNVVHLMTCFVLVLHEEFKFGHKRILRCLQAIDKYMNMINNDEITIDYLLKRAEDETGIIIECKN